MPRKYGSAVRRTVRDWGCVNGTAHHWRLDEPGNGAEFAAGVCLKCEAARGGFRVTIPEVDTRQFKHRKTVGQ